MRVPLIRPVVAVVRRLDIDATWDVNPPGTPTKGYNPILREPILYDHPTTGARTSPRVEGAEIRIPCQLEVQTFERLRMTFDGNAPVTEFVVVMHRIHLDPLGLIDAATGRCVLKARDRIVRIEASPVSTRVVQTFKKELYIYEVRPRSHGMGPDGHDLEIAYTTYDDPSSGG